MDEADRRRAEAAEHPERWRVGESRGTGRRNLYRGAVQVGRVDSPEVAEFLVGLANAEVDRLEQVGRDRAGVGKRFRGRCSSCMDPAHPDGQCPAYSRGVRCDCVDYTEA